MFTLLLNSDRRLEKKLTKFNSQRLFKGLVEGFAV